MSEQTRQTALSGSAGIEFDAETRELTEMAAWKMDNFFARHQGLSPIELPNLQTLKFSVLSFSDSAEAVSVIAFEHDARANFVAETPEDHESVQTLFVSRPGAGLHCFEDDMKDERGLMDEGNFEGLIALRAQKKVALTDPANVSPLNKDEAIQLSRLLRSAEEALTSV